MYLKQIEIQGFKSFANQTIMTFDKGLTCIVGPNGSGKSNVADAVRWVLGEMSAKQLRGGNMQDVIFSGTETRKPQGYAYVAILFDNHDRKLALDFDEIEISRRLFRSGDSEYSINKTKCRLKDIYELFYDTGIGKEGYSIIGQGQIDRILSNKPEDRRELFDEAAGIVKYKRKKNEATKKLEEVDNILSSQILLIEDIESRITPLKEKAEAAKKYLELHDELIKYEANYFVREVDNENEFIIECDKNLKINADDLARINKQKEEFDTKNREIDLSIEDIDLTINKIKDEINFSNTERERLIGDNKLLQEQISNAEKDNVSRLETIDNYNKTIFDTLGDIESSLVFLNSLNNQIIFIKKNKDVDHNETATIDTDLVNIDKSINETIEIVKSNMGSEYDFDLNTDDNILFENDSTFSTLNDKRKEIEKIEETIKDLNKEIDDVNNKIIKTSDELEEVNKDYIDAQNLFHSEEARLSAIKDLLDRYDGYGNTIKSIMDNKNDFKGIKGLVAEIIETEEKYQEAIETALGNSVQFIVADNAETIKNIIKFIKDKKLGRATFLPLDGLNIKDFDDYKKALNEKGVIDLAVNLVNYKKEYTDLANFLLRRCLVVDNFDNANAISKKYNQRLKIVTLQGEVFNVGGAITGGEFKNQSNLLGRKIEHDKIKKEIESTANKINDYKSKKEKLDEDLSLLNKDYKHKNEVLNKMQLDLNTLTLNVLSEIKLEYSNISSKANHTINDLSRFCILFKDTYDKKLKLESGDLDFKNTIKEKYNNIESNENRINEIANNLIEFNKTIKNKEVEKANLIDNRKMYIETKDRIADDLIRLSKQELDLTNKKETATRKIEDISNKVFDDYGMTYVNAKEKFDPNLGSLNSIKDELKNKRRVIQDLGPIDVNAIKEFEELGDKYIKIQQRYQDIKKSKDELLNIIKDLDDIMNSQFDQNFKIIKEEFDKVFKILFGGGEAKLELMEVENGEELDAGVAIVVKPPGKPYVNMMQLSGGEKALTAIALLFAIQNLKPSPFCLLDEIEAALDEANINRYADYLLNLTGNTQFIVITHRRGTMERADRLYGITMQERGVTSLVSIDLVEQSIQ